MTRARRAGVGLTAAREQVRVARALGELPADEGELVRKAIQAALDSLREEAWAEAADEVDHDSAEASGPPHDSAEASGPPHDSAEASDDPQVPDSGRRR